MGKSQYKIQFGGLSMGEHQFEFDIKGKFFEQFSESEITEADIQVKANLVKQNTLTHILFTFEGTIKLSCDRCLVDYNCPIFGQEKLIIKHGNPEESNDEIEEETQEVEDITYEQALEWKKRLQKAEKKLVDLKKQAKTKEKQTDNPISSKDSGIPVIKSMVLSICESL